MSPFQHGEVFVTADGAEADLDLGHYERFVQHDDRAAQQLHDRDAFTNPLFARSAAATTWERPCRSFRILPMRSKQSVQTRRR